MSYRNNGLGLSQEEIDALADTDSDIEPVYDGGAIFDNEPVTIRDVVGSRHVVGDSPGLGDKLWGPQADRFFR